MKDRVYLGKWRSEKARLRFRAMEDELWREACAGAELPEALDVETQFGPTRAYRWRGVGEPIVFLHGIGGTSLIWVPYAHALRGRDVYGIDIMCDVGRSEHQVAFESASDLAIWLDETLAGLGIERGHIVGLSLGGYVALSSAVHRPVRVASLVLFDPGGMVELNMLRFMLWGLPVLFGSLAPSLVRRWLARKLRMPLLENKRAVRLALHGQLHHPPRFPPLTLFTDDELRSVTAPVTLLVGEKTEMFDVQELVERASALLPDVQAELVPGAGHALTVSHPDHCASRIARAVGDTRE